MSFIWQGNHLQKEIMKNTLKSIRKSTGYSQAQFSRMYHIPLRNIERWETGKINPYEWVMYLLTRCTAHKGFINAETDMPLSTRLKNVRTDHKLTQAQMEEIYHIPKRTYERWESGDRKPAEWIVLLIENDSKAGII